MANPTDLALTVAPTTDPTRVRAADGTVLAVPAGWALLPPGDAGLTRRVKAASELSSGHGRSSRRPTSHCENRW